MFTTTYLLRPLTKPCRTWVEDHLKYESWQRISTGIAVDHHYIEEIVFGMVEDGLVDGQDFDVVC